MTKSLTTLAALAVACFASAGWAQGKPTVGPGLAMIRSGGIGIEERAAFNEARDRYNLRLAFAETSGNYVADVAVRLSTPDGRTLYEADGTGPFLFAKLAPGRYRLEAEHEGMTQVRTLTVDAAQAAPLVHLHWPAGG